MSPSFHVSRLLQDAPSEQALPGPTQVSLSFLEAQGNQSVSTDPPVNRLHHKLPPSTAQKHEKSFVCVTDSSEEMLP